MILGLFLSASVLKYGLVSRFLDLRQWSMNRYITIVYYYYELPSSLKDQNKLELEDRLSLDWNEKRGERSWCYYYSVPQHQSNKLTIETFYVGSLKTGKESPTHHPLAICTPYSIVSPFFLRGAETHRLQMISHEGKVYFLIKEATELTLFNDNVSCLIFLSRPLPLFLLLPSGSVTKKIWTNYVDDL